MSSEGSNHAPALSEHALGDHDLREASELLRSYRATLWTRSRPGWRLTFVGAEIESLLGYPSQRFLDEWGFWASVVHPDDRVATLGRLVHALDTGAPASIRYRAVRADGSVVWLQDTLVAGDRAAREDVPERVMGMTAMSARPSAFRRVGTHGVDDTAAIANDAIYQRIVDECPKALAVHRDGIIRFVNAAGARLIGATDPETLIDRFIGDFIEPSSRDAALARVRRVQDEGVEERGVDEQFVCLDGTIIDVEVTSAPYVFQGERAVLSIATNVTERRKAENVQRLYAAALRASRDGIALIQLDGGEVFDVNPSWERMTGQRRDDVVGRTLREVGPWLSDDRRTAFLERLDADGSVRDFECVVVRASDGSARQVVLSSDVVRLNDVPHALIFACDLTEQREAETQQRRSQKLEAIGRLAGGIAHDFNNLLTVMLSHGRIALATIDADPAETRASLEEVNAAAGRAAELTKQLLGFSRGTATSEQALVDVNDSVASTAQMLKHVLGDRIALSVRLSNEPERILGDRGQLEQVLLNLAMNARDAMPEGGTLEIATGHVMHGVRKGAPSSHGGRSANDEYVVVRVTDTGEGMDAATSERLFEPFFSTKPVGQGTGLGLSTAYGIVRQHGGWIRFVTALGEGTTFAVYLPRAASP